MGLTEATALRLAEETTALRKDIAQLSEAIANTQSQQRRTRIGLAILAVITLAFAALAWANYRTNEAQQATAAQQDALVRDFICPSSALLVGGYRPNSRPPGEAQDAYADAIEGMRIARARLACADELVPPAEPAPVPVPAAPAPTEAPR